MAAGVVTDGNHLQALVGEQLGSPASHVAEALDSYCAFFRLFAELLNGEHGIEHDAPAGSRHAAFGTTKVERLAGYHPRGITIDAAVFVENPGHFPAAGSHVGGGNVGIFAENVLQHAGVGAGNALKLVNRADFGVQGNAAFGTAIGKPHKRALEGHPAGEGLYFI